MRLIIHDLDQADFHRISAHFPGDQRVVSPGNGSIAHCLGCFGCWVKTPGACVIRDQYGDLGELLAQCKEVTIISRCCYGGFSPFVKNVLDRSISYVLPFFVIKDGVMRHKRRYAKSARLRVWFYGEISEQEMATALGLAQASAVNLWWDLVGVSFFRDAAELEGQML